MKKAMKCAVRIMRDEGESVVNRLSVWSTGYPQVVILEFGNIFPSPIALPPLYPRESWYIPECQGVSCRKVSRAIKDLPVESLVCRMRQESRQLET